jgi:hypothetical protein
MSTAQVARLKPNGAPAESLIIFGGRNLMILKVILADRTGLEPAPPDVTGGPRPEPPHAPFNGGRMGARKRAALPRSRQSLVDCGGTRSEGGGASSDSQRSLRPLSSSASAIRAGDSVDGRRGAGRLRRFCRGRLIIEELDRNARGCRRLRTRSGRASRACLAIASTGPRTTSYIFQADRRPAGFLPFLPRFYKACEPRDGLHSNGRCAPSGRCTRYDRSASLRKMLSQ